ncbi:unnamed protein product [Acanthosepion pharaonis]|uniref:Uncharacterized protein n=1 Tax=Acanthosepion pharaonis TaxID=158019 RepID=A0A812DXD4_ACAPH|nr:unnamed protein product [Sepia pharaonis]
MGFRQTNRVARRASGDGEDRQLAGFGSYRFSCNRDDVNTILSRRILASGLSDKLPLSPSLTTRSSQSSPASISRSSPASSSSSSAAAAEQPSFISRPTSFNQQQQSSPASSSSSAGRPASFSSSRAVQLQLAAAADRPSFTSSSSRLHDMHYRVITNVLLLELLSCDPARQSYQGRTDYTSAVRVDPLSPQAPTRSLHKYRHPGIDWTSNIAVPSAYLQAVALKPDNAPSKLHDRTTTNDYLYILVPDYLIKFRCNNHHIYLKLGEEKDGKKESMVRTREKITTSYSDNERAPLTVGSPSTNKACIGPLLRVPISEKAKSANPTTLSPKSSNPSFVLLQPKQLSDCFYCCPLTAGQVIPMFTRYNPHPHPLETGSTAPSKASSTNSLSDSPYTTFFFCMFINHPWRSVGLPL